MDQYFNLDYRVEHLSGLLAYITDNEIATIKNELDNQFSINKIYKEQIEKLIKTNKILEEKIEKLEKKINEEINKMKEDLVHCKMENFVIKKIQQKK